jgi:copper transport protein
MRTLTRAMGVRPSLFALLLWVLIGLSGSNIAFAHSSLLQTTPADGGVLATAPHAARLIFNEPVAPEVVTLITPDGRHRALTDIQTIHNGLSVSLPQLERPGTYALSWRITSADGHPVGGTLLFSIGTTSNQTAIAQPEARGLPEAIWVDRIALYVGLLFGVGSVVFGALIAPLGIRTRRFATRALVLALLSMPMALALQGMDALATDWSSLIHASIWRAAMNTSYGTSVSLMLAAALTAFVTLVYGSTPFGDGSTPPNAKQLGNTRERLLAALCALLLAGAFAASGHAGTAAPFWLARPAVFLHILGVLTWVGSLAPLIGLLRESTQQSSAGLARFSRAIPFALIVLVASGVTLIMMQIDRPAALWQTDYGQVLCIKLCLLLALLGVAAWNRYRLTDDAASGHRVARRKLIASIRIEIFLVVAILAVVSLWRFTPPPRALDAHLAGVPITVHLHDDRIMAQLTLNLRPDGHGNATIAIENADGKPLRPQALTLDLGNAADGVEAFSREAVANQNDQWAVDPLTIPIAGTWEITLDVLISDFDQLHLRERVQIPYPAH